MRRRQTHPVHRLGSSPFTDGGDDREHPSPQEDLMPTDETAEGANTDRRQRARRIMRDVIGVDASAPRTPYTALGMDFIYGDLWSRPILTRKERRWITLCCV